jgi:predicted dehydrogenase/nucleoside-diphosphate-sugar epimerase
MEQRDTVAILGCGLIADIHVEALLEAVPKSRICVCDPVPGKAYLLAAKYRLGAVYTDLGRMLAAEKPFAVHILTPPHLHAENTAVCLTHGCHVLVEKPLCLRVEDANRLYSMARTAARTLAVDHSLVFQPAVLRMMELLRRNPDEKIVNVHCLYGLDLPKTGISIPEGHWKGNLPGGPVIDTLVHPVSLAAYLVGPPLDVSVYSGRSAQQYSDTTLVWRTSGATVVISVSAMAKPFRRVTEVATTSRTFLIDHTTESLVVLGEGSGPRAVRKIMRNLSHARQLVMGTLHTVSEFVRGNVKENQGARNAVRAFHEQIRGNGDNPVTQEDVLSSVSVLEQVAAKFPRSHVGAQSSEDSAKRGSTASAGRVGDTSALGRALVTGASGMLGQQLCRELTEQGFDVVAQVRRGARADRVGGSSVFPLYCDFLDDHVDFDELVKGCSIVVHCAHASQARSWGPYERVNVLATQELYEAARRTGCRRFVYVSSVAVYGVGGWKSRTVREEDRLPRRMPKYDFYIRSKICAERALERLRRTGGPEVLVVRPGLLYSAAGERLCRRAVPLGDTHYVLSFGAGRNRLPFTRVDAVAKAIARAACADVFPTGTYNLTGEMREGSRQFVRTRMRRLGVKCRFLTMPTTLFRAAGSLFEAIRLISGSPYAPRISRYVIDSATRDIVYDTSGAASKLGWDPSNAVALAESK